MECPHIIFHGPNGSGKRTMVRLYLNMLFKGETEKMTTRKYMIKGSGSKLKEESIKESAYHIVIKPTGTNFDRYVVQDVIKKYAAVNTFNMLNDDLGVHNTTNKLTKRTHFPKFRVIYIPNIDKFSQSAQQSLRRLMETNSNRCRFVMWANNLSNVITPLQSRGFCIRVPRPTNDELFAYLTYIATHKLNYDISLEKMNNIIKYAENDINTALWCLQSSFYNLPFTINSDQSISMVVDMICKCDVGLLDDSGKAINTQKSKGKKKITVKSRKKKKNDDSQNLDIGDLNDDKDKVNADEIFFKERRTGNKGIIRDLLFNLMITNFSPIDILQALVKEFIKRPDLTEEMKINIIMQTSIAEYNMVRSRREIIQFDAYVAAIQLIINSCKA